MKLPKNRRGDTSKGKATPSKTAVKRKTKKVVSGGRPGSRGGRKAGSSFKKTKVKSVSEMAQITKVKKREAIDQKRKEAVAKAKKRNEIRKEKINKNTAKKVKKDSEKHADITKKTTKAMHALEQQEIRLAKEIKMLGKSHKYKAKREKLKAKKIKIGNKIESKHAKYESKVYGKAKKIKARGEKKIVKANKTMSISQKRAQKRSARKKRNMAVTGIKRWDTTWK